MGTGDTAVLWFRNGFDIVHDAALPTSSLLRTLVFTPLPSLRIPHTKTTTSLDKISIGQGRPTRSGTTSVTTPRLALTYATSPVHRAPTPSHRFRRKAANALFEKEKEERLERARRKRQVEEEAEARTTEAAAPRGRKVMHNLIFVWHSTDRAPSCLVQISFGLGCRLSGE